MSFLAFDPDQLRALVLRVQLVLVELASLPTDDPSATVADRAVRDVMRSLQLGLLPAVRRVLDSPPLRSPIDPRDDLDALPNAAAREMAVARGWSVGLDPLRDDPTVVSAEEAAALARRLRGIEPHELFDDPERLEWVTGALHAIALDPALCRVFDREFARWAAWADEAAVRRLLLLRVGSATDPTRAAALARLDAFVRAVAGVAQGTVDLSGRAARPLPWLDDAGPYAAAMLLGALDLPTGMFRGLALRVLRRGPDPLDGIGPTAADLVLQAVLLRPDVLTGFTVAAIEGADLLRAPQLDQELLGRLLVRATDLSRADSATAGRVLVPVLRAVLDGPPPLAETVLADLVAPWTAQFLATNHEWGLSAAERSRMLRAALRSTEAVERLVDRGDVVVAGARHTFLDGDARSVAEFDSYLGAMGVILMDERVRRTVLRQRAWDTVCNIAGMATAFIPWAAVGLAASAAVVVIHNQNMPDVRAAQTESLFLADAALTQAGATVVSSMHAMYVRRGYVSEDLPPPPDANPNSGDVTSADYIWRFLDWEETLPDGQDGYYARSIRLGLYTILSPSQISEHVWWIANGFPGT